MFNRITDNRFNEITDFKNVIMQNTLKKKTFKEFPESRDIFRTKASIYDGAFL